MDVRRKPYYQAPALMALGGVGEDDELVELPIQDRTPLVHHVAHTCDRGQGGFCSVMLLGGLPQVQRN